MRERSTCGAAAFQENPPDRRTVSPMLGGQHVKARTWDVPPDLPQREQPAERSRLSAQRCRHGRSPQAGRATGLRTPSETEKDRRR